METPSDFPHLELVLQLECEPKFQGGQRKDEEVAKNRANPQAHSDRIQKVLDSMRQSDRELRRFRDVILNFAPLFDVTLPPELQQTRAEVESVAWIQNARVLNKDNRLPDTLPPEKYLPQVVAPFHASPHFTKIFNHSINAQVPWPRRRMPSWGARLDQLSHEQEVLSIQAAGNQSRYGNGDQANPGLAAHLDAGPSVCLCPTRFNPQIP